MIVEESAISSPSTHKDGLTAGSGSYPVMIMGLNFLRPLRAFGAVSTFAIFFSACQQPTQITLEITTDIDCALGPNTAIIVGNAGAESNTPGTVTDMCSGGRIGAIVLLPKSSKDEKISIRVVTGVGASFTAEDCLDDPDLQKQRTEGVVAGCVIARRSLSFIPHTPLFLPVKMRGVCLGKPCDPNSTCSLKGECVPAQITDPNSCSDPEGCVPPGESPDATGGAGGAGSTSTSVSGSGGMGGMLMTDGGATGGSGGIVTMKDGGLSSSTGGFGGTGGAGTGGLSGTGGMGGMPGTGGMGGMPGTGGMGGMPGTGGMGGKMDVADAGTNMLDGGTTGKDAGIAGMGGTGGTGGIPVTSGTGGIGGMIATGGTGGIPVTSGTGGTPMTSGTGGMGGMTTTSGSGPSTTGSSGSSSGGLVGGEDGLIPPGYLVPGQQYALPPRRTKVRRTPTRTTAPLRLPLNTYPRNVKP